MKTSAIIVLAVAVMVESTKVTMYRNEDARAVSTKEDDGAQFKKNLDQAASKTVASKPKLFTANGNWKGESIETRPLDHTKFANKKSVNGTRVVSSSETFCEVFEPYIPSSYCTCIDEGTLGATIECSYAIVEDYITVDTLGLILKLDPCANPMFYSIDVTEADLGIDLYYELTGDSEEKFPLPGLSYPIPPFGEVGLFMDVYISGNVAELTLDFGVDICLMDGSEECASEYYPYDTVFPVWIIEGIFDFSDICAAV